LNIPLKARSILPERYCAIQVAAPTLILKYTMTQDIIKLLTLVLGISVAGERLVTIIKSFTPWLPAPAGTGATGPVTNSDIAKRIALIVISFGCCLLTTALFHKNAPSLSAFDMGTVGKISSWIVALMATGGSAFWTNLLGYFSALKDATNLQAAQSKQTVDAHAFTSRSKVKEHVHDDDLVPVTFTAAFTGGAGNLNIKIYPDGPSFGFDKDGSQTINLPSGVVKFQVTGAPSNGPKGGATLTIDGASISNSPISFGPGTIEPPKQEIMTV
jgi:hypothetical protein